MDLKKHIRNVKDFPKPGIMFRDITTLLINPEAFAYTLDQLLEFTKGKQINKTELLQVMERVRWNCYLIQRIRM